MKTGDGRKPPRGNSRIAEFVRTHGLLCGFLLVMIVAALAFESARTEESGGLPVFDSLYRSLRMFVLEFEMPQGAEDHVFLSWLLTILSYAAVVISSSAVIGVFAQRLGAPLRLRWQAWRHRSGIWALLPNDEWRQPRKRALLLGFGMINRAVAQTLTARNYSITAIDKRFDEPAQLIARNSGVLLVPGDLSDTSSLQRGLMADADIVIVSTGNDVTNIEIASAAHTLVPGANIYAHVASPGFSDDLRESIDTGFPLADGIRTFSVKQESARNLLRQAHLAREARERDQKAVHLVIVGMGDQGEAILLEALQSTISVGLAPPHITLVDRDAHLIEARFKARHPSFYTDALPKEVEPTIRFRNIDIEAADFTQAQASWTGDIPVTAYVFCCGEDATNLAAGLRLELAMSIGRRPPAPIFLTVWGAGIDLERYDGRDPLGHCVLFGAVEPTIAGAAFLKGDPDLFASNLHDAYEDQRVGSKPGVVRRPWAAMPQTMKESNRRAVRHSHVKLVDMDLHWRGMGAADLPTIATDVADMLHKVPVDIDSPAILDARVTAPLPDTLMAKLAETEHRRWLLDRALDGWRGTAKGRRDDTARLHPNMVPFRDLESDYQHFDTVLVRTLIERFAEPDHNPVVAYAAKRSCLVIQPDGTADGTIVTDTTELIIAFPAQNYLLNATPSSELAKKVSDWAKTPKASRVRVVLAKRFSVGVPGSAAALSASYLRALVRSVPASIDLSVSHLYDGGAQPAAAEVAQDVRLVPAIEPGQP